MSREPAPFPMTIAADTPTAFVPVPFPCASDPPLTHPLHRPTVFLDDQAVDVDSDGRSVDANERSAVDEDEYDYSDSFMSVEFLSSCAYLCN